MNAWANVALPGLSTLPCVTNTALEITRQLWLLKPNYDNFDVSQHVEVFVFLNSLQPGTSPLIKWRLPAFSLVYDNFLPSSQTRSLPSPCDSCWNPVIPAESGGIKFGRQFCQICHSGDNKFWRNLAIPELRPEWSPELTRMESGGMQ